MHAVLYVCIPAIEARNSLQARKKVCEYLIEENFNTQGRFGGHCDYFSVGGRRWSGRLQLLRLRSEQPKVLDRFWKKYQRVSSDEDAAEIRRQFKKSFPDYRGRLPFDREDPGFYGHPDDAQIMDEPLFRLLKGGFSDCVDYSHEINEPNVIFTFDEGDDAVWPGNKKEAAEFWVVVIDYHW
jgi:hypothetical protein